MTITTVYKANHIIFKTGDPANKMYLIRKGSVKVYFENSDEEVTLAILKEGAIFGEMAFFDKLTRSACVKTIDSSEITEILRDDFDKLIKQIPKWFVSMMQSLSLRLRQANEKIKSIEASGGLSLGLAHKTSIGSHILPHQRHPYQHVIHALKIILLSLSKNGVHEDHHIVLPFENVKLIWDEFFPEETELFEKIVDATEKIGFLEKKRTHAGIKNIYIANKSSFSHFIDLFSQLAKKIPITNPYFSDSCIGLLDAMVKFLISNGHSQFNFKLEHFIIESQKHGIDTTDWVISVNQLSRIPDIKVEQRAGDSYIHLQTKEHKILLDYILKISIYNSNNLA